MRRFCVAVFALTILVGRAKMSGQARSALANPLIREEQKIVVNGVPEVWRLQWKSPPEVADCGPEDPSGAMTCPCSGFAYGESGQMDLIRIRDGGEIDHLELTPLFE